MKIEMKRKLDDLGRLVLPIELRSHYGINSGDEVVLLPVQGGILIVKWECAALEQLPENMTATVDELGRIVVPSAYMNYYDLQPNDVMTLVPTEACIVMTKNQ